jgi:ribosomal protein S7
MNTKIIKQILIKGQISISEKIWLKSIKLFYRSFKKNHKKVINRALINVAPLVKMKQLKKKRSSVKEFPYITNNKNRFSSALKNFFTITNNKTDLKFHRKLVNELLYATKNVGGNVGKKKSLYEYAFIKKKYFFYRWF